MIDFIELTSTFDLIMLFWVLPSLITYLPVLWIFKNDDTLQSITHSEWGLIHFISIFYPIFYIGTILGLVCELAYSYTAKLWYVLSKDL